VIFYACTSVSCSAILRVAGFDGDEVNLLIGRESEWFPDKYPCPTCGERMAVHTKCPEADPKFIDLSPQEAYSAFCGAGLPSEQECSASRVRELLITQRITDVRVRHIRGTNRCTLDQIILENGLTLHMASSTHGASVYRIQAPGAFVEALDEHHPAPQETP
jgi:hypothetical protein